MSIQYWRTEELANRIAALEQQLAAALQEIETRSVSLEPPIAADPFSGDFGAFGSRAARDPAILTTDTPAIVRVQHTFNNEVTPQAPFLLGPNAAGQLVSGLNADRLDGAHASAAPAASTIPIADASGKLAPAWMPAIGCRVIKSAAQTIPNTTWTPIQFDAEYFDTDAMHDPVTNNTRITIKTAGYYMLGGCVEWASNTVGMRIMAVRKNNAQHLVDAVHNSDQYGAAPGSLSTVAYLAANDYIELLVYQASGGNLNTATLYDYSPVFWAMRIG